MISRYKTKDGYIDYDTRTQCFTYYGESAVNAGHKHNKLFNKYGKIVDECFLKSLDKKLTRVSLTA